MKKIFIILIVSCLFSCNPKTTESESVQFEAHGDTIVVTDKSDLVGKLKTDILKSSSYRLQITTAGTVKAIPTQYAEIAPPFQGRVIKSYIKLGMKTTPETPLFEISSPDFIAAQKNFFQEKSQMQQAEKTLKRQQDLIANGVGTQKDLEEAQTAYEIGKKEYENAVIGIKIFKADPDNLSLGQPLIVRSPIVGEVIDNKVVVGQFINDNAATVATVAELSEVWVTGKVKEKDIRFIHENDDCDIEIVALPDKKISGKVYHINKMVDEETRSVDVYIVVDNKDGDMKKGMYANIQFNDTPVNAILIPTKAVFLMNENSFVFLEIAPNKYMRRKIIIDGDDPVTGKIVVKSGLNVGDKIITEGGYFLLQVK
jgi:cobalt-zinc-cadmium efflux system membrane fusion protein